MVYDGKSAYAEVNKAVVYLRYGGALQNLTLKLPVTINKFFQPTEMASHDFFQRWKQLSQYVFVYTQDKLLYRYIINCSLNEKHVKFSPHRPQQEAQKIFKANHAMDTEVLKAKVSLHSLTLTVFVIILAYCVLYVLYTTQG